jgi:hypothetical protein
MFFLIASIAVILLLLLLIDIAWRGVKELRKVCLTLERLADLNKTSASGSYYERI